MRKRSSNKKTARKDLNELATEIVQKATHNHHETFIQDSDTSSGQQEKNPAAVELGRRGGKKGGPARAKKLTKEERSETARKAARARWDREID